MPEREQMHTTIVPFLTRFAVPRTGDANIPGHYDKALQVWVTESSPFPIPIVESGACLVELATKTDAVRERDDPGETSTCLTELTTKTAIKSEQDDVTMASPWLLNLATTTKIGAERPDF